MERVYVGNLPPDIRIKDIDDFFRPFGKLVAIDVNNRGNPAFAFVQFDSTRNALSAVRNRHGYDYEGYTLQVKLVDNNVGTGNFEVRNQRRQITPPPPPPLFNNDFNNQMGGGFGNNNNANNFGRGNSGGGNNNFGGGNRNFGGNNFGSNNSNFGSNNSNFGANNSNFGSNNSNFGANNSNFGSNNSGNFGNDNFSSSSSSFQRNTSSQNMIQYPNTNVRSIMPAQNNMIEYPNNNVWNNGSGANSNRNSNRGGGGGGNFSNMGNDFNNMGGGGGDYVYNPNNNCYADNDFEDRFTQGLSGSGRKWFNRYIRKGLTPKIAREKALEHRTLPYLREGGRNQTPNNAVPNLPLPALENFGNKIMSLFSGNNAGGNFGGGGNANQMMSNFNNWGNNNNNMQRGGGGGFSNDFNMAGPSSSNNRSGNRNEIRSLVPMRGGAAVNRGGRPEAGRGAEPGILEKMLAEIPSSKQQFVAKTKYDNSKSYLENLDQKTARGSLSKQDIEDRMYHRQIVQEYEIWIKKQKIPTKTQTKKTDTIAKDKTIKKDVNNDSTKPIKTLDDTYKYIQKARYKSALNFVTQFEWRKLKSMTKKEKRKYEECTQLIFAYEKRQKAKQQKADTNLVKEKTAVELWLEYENYKTELSEEAANLNDPTKEFADSEKQRMLFLIDETGITEKEAKFLARLPQEKLEKLVSLKTNHASKTGQDIFYVQKNTEDNFYYFKNYRTRKVYESSLKFLKKFEDNNLRNLTEKESGLLRACLQRKIRIEEEAGVPVVPTRYDHMLTDETDEGANDNVEKDENSNKTQDVPNSSADCVDITENLETTESALEIDTNDLSEQQKLQKINIMKQQYLKKISQA